MKVITLLLFTLLLSSCGSNREATDEASINKTLDAYAKAYSKQDADKLASLWAPDGVYIDLTSQDMVQGNEAIAQYLLQKYEAGSTITIQSEKLQIEETGKAIEQGTIRLSSKNAAPESIIFKAVLAKGQDGSWLLQQISEYELQPPSSHYEHLKPLEWLIGTWIDEDENVAVDINYEWGHNKNFIIQHFTSKILGKDQISGQQVIGWDPSTNKIRSWIFDDNGGFGESTWSNQESAWYSQMSFVLPDGRKGSTTHIYTKDGPDAYTFTSGSREIDGTLLPDIGPFKILRKQ